MPEDFQWLVIYQHAGYSSPRSFCFCDAMRLGDLIAAAEGLRSFGGTDQKYQVESRDMRG